MDGSERLHTGKLREQGVAALHELLLGFERADRLVGGALLRGYRLEDVYIGLVTALMRMVFILHAEGQGLLPAESDSLTRLYAQLLSDRGRHGDTLGDRYGAWRRVVDLVRALHDGARGGALFDPEAFPFLGGRSLDLPRVSDGAVLRVLERLQGPGVDVEVIGGVYEGLMGFELQAEGESLSLRPGAARRRTGSHYTPRALTQPIVETALQPLVARLGPELTPDQILELRVCDPAMGSGAFLLEACRQLADRLVEAWERTRTVPALSPGEDPVSRARRMIAERCIYGVDKNPLAVDLARLSLWLFASAKGRPFTFVDHALRHGDSLVGLSVDQISSLTPDVAEGVERAARLRRGALWGDADEVLRPVKAAGDLVVAAYFSRGSDKARKEALRDPLLPFHWEVEFPEVFAATEARGQGGFDCLVGNPPFLGGTMISTAFGKAYLDYLIDSTPGSGNRMDLVAYFFRRAFQLCRQRGTIGFVSTNTIAQGDTRAGGLFWLKKHGASIYSASRRIRWPGDASVVVSVVHLEKGGDPTTAADLDGRPAQAISAYLFSRGGDDAPRPLRRNAGLSFAGSKIYGQGFLFDDGDSAATPLREAHRLIAEDERHRERIRPYLGGEDVNAHPAQRAGRYVIDLGDMTEAEARGFPRLLAILEAKVRPARRAAPRDVASWPWWQFWRTRRELYAAIAPLGRVLVVARVSRSAAFAFVEPDQVFSEQLNVFALEGYPAFSVLQSSIHDGWARFFGSSMRDDLRYALTDCFETFPFPLGVLPGSAGPCSPALDAVGQATYERRAALMITRGEGLTRIYHRVHDPEERSPGVLELRRLHADMDRAVLDAYGWTDLAPAYDFRRQLDGSIRYTWAEETRDEVLARLLEQNRVMAEAEGPIKPSRRRRGALCQGRG